MTRRVLFLGLDTYSRVGGIQRFNQRLIAALLRMPGIGQADAFLMRDKPEDIPAALRTRVRGFGAQRLGLIAALPGAARRADILILGHVNLLPLALLAKLAAPRLKIVLIVHGIEVWNDPAYRLRRFHEPALLRLVDRIASVSRYTARIMAGEFRQPQARFRIFPNTVDAPAAVTATPESPAYLLAVSRMNAHDRGKNLDQLIRAMALLPETLSHVRLILVGDGSIRPELEALAAAEGVSGRVVFAGRVDDAELDRLYRGATAFTLPSSKEGFGIVYLEAWCHGLPVLCSTQGAAPEVVSDREDGFAVDPADTALLAERIATLLQNPAMAREMGRRGTEKVRALYSTKALDANLADLIGDL